MDSTSPLGVENTESVSEDPLANLLKTASPTYLEYYGLVAPVAPNIDDYNFPTKDNAPVAPLRALGDDVNYAQRFAEYEDAYKVYEQNFKAVEDAYKSDFDAYATKFDTYKEGFQGGYNRLIREAVPALLQQGIETGDFSNLQKREQSKVGKAPVLIDGVVSYRARHNASDMLQGLRLDDGSIDEYLNTQLDFDSELAQLKLDLQDAQAKKNEYVSRLKSAPLGDATLAQLDKNVQDLQNSLDESGDLTEQYIKDRKALTLKQFMQMNMMAQLNKIAEIEGYEKGSAEYKELAMAIEKDVYAASLYGEDFYEVQDAFAGTAVGPDMFKFLLDDENVLGRENSYWEDAATSWSIGNLELEKMGDAYVTASRADAYVESKPGFVVGGLSPIGFVGRSDADQRRREKRHLEKRKRIEAEQFDLQNEMSQYAINAKTWELFGEDAIMSEDELADRGLGIRMAITDQLTGIEGDIERRYQMEAIQSMPVSLTLMAPGLLAAPFTGGLSVGQAFLATSLPTFITTTAMVGSDRYYETLLNDLTPGTEKYKFDTPSDRFWHSARYGGFEGIGEGVGTGLAGVAGKVLRLSRFNPYLPTGVSTSTRMGKALDASYRFGRGGMGLSLALGVGVIEEREAEAVTGFFQGFDGALAQGKPLQEAFMEGKEMANHGRAVGKYMGLLPVGGVAITQAKATYTRHVSAKKGDGKYAMMQMLAHFDQFSNDAISAGQRAKLQRLMEGLSEKALAFPTKKDKAILEKIEVELGKIDASKKLNIEALQHLGESNPALVAEMLVANNYNQFLQNVLNAYRFEDNVGLRDSNGRPAPKSNNPMYDYVNNLTSDQRAEIYQQYKDGGNRIASINGQLAFFQGRFKNGIDTFEGVGNLNYDYTDQEFEGVSEVTISASGEVSGVENLESSQRDVLQKYIDEAKRSGVQIKIVLHTDESMAYVETGDSSRLESVRDKDGRVYAEGLYALGKEGGHEIHIHKDTDLNRVAFHESTHLFLEPLFQQNPELVYNLADQIRELGKSNWRIQKLVDAVKEIEVVAEIEGSRGAMDRELVTALLEAMTEGEFIRGSETIKGFEISDLGVKAVLKDMFAGVAGFPEVSSDSDLINLALRFKAFAEGRSDLGVLPTTLEQAQAKKETEEVNGDAPLGSKRYLENTEIFWKQNANAFGDSRARPDLFQQDRNRSKVFNDYRHFANWYNSMTGNGMREGIIRDIHFYRDGKRFNLNFPKPKLDKNGQRVAMKAKLVTFKEKQVAEFAATVDTGTEVSTKESALSQEIVGIYDNNFKGVHGPEGRFSLDFHSFKPVVKEEDLSRITLAQIHLQQRNNMLALMALNVDIAQVHADLVKKGGEKVYVLNRQNAPQIFDLADQVEFLTREQSNERLVTEAAELGINVYDLLPENSLSRRKRVTDPAMIPENELVYATIRLEEIKEGGEFIYESPARRGGLSSRVASESIETNVTQEEAEALGAIFGENRRDALLKLGYPIDWLRRNLVSKALLYDRTKHGIATWEIKTKEGLSIDSPDAMFQQNQMGGPLGAVNSSLPMLSSHIDQGSALSMMRMPPGKQMLAVDIALRAPGNTLRSPSTIGAFFRYALQYHSVNKANGNDYTKDMIEALNSVLEGNLIPKTVEGVGQGKTQKTSISTRGAKIYESKYSKLRSLLNAYALRNKPGIVFKDQQLIRVTNEQGLISLLEYLGNLPEGTLESMKFGGRAAVISAMTRGMAAKGHKGFVTNKEILEIMDDPRWAKMDSKGTGKIVATYVALAKDLSYTNTSELTEGQNNGFPNAVMATLPEDVKYLLYEKSSDADVIYQPELLKQGPQARKKKGFGHSQGQFSIYAEGTQALRSRRLGGRIQHSGNSQWEKSTATPYGEQLAYFTRRLQDKFSDVMLLQQDIEEFRGSKVPENQDFEMSIDLYYGKMREDMEKLEVNLQDIGAALKASGNTIEELSDLMYALHARERNTNIKGKRPDLESGSGMTNEEAEQIIDDLLTPELLDVANMVYDILDDTRATMVNGGLETQEVVSHWEGLYDNYVPLPGLAIDENSEESNSYPTGGSGFSVYGPSGRRAKGRKSRTGTNLVAAVISQNLATKQRARKDETMRALHEMIQQNPNENVWRLYSEQAPMTKLAEDGSQKKMSLIEMKAHTNTVPLRINGKQHFIYFKDVGYADALNGLTEEEAGSAVKNMGKYISLLREFATVYNPAFFVSNYMRDIGSAVYNAMAEVERDGGIMTDFGLKPMKFSANIVKTSFQVLKPLLKEGVFGADLSPEMAQMMQEWKESGGRTGWAYSDTLKEIQAKLEAASENPQDSKKILKGFYQGKAIFEKIEAINEAFENATRFAAYIEARRAGATKQRAAQLSKNITVNFNRAGEASSSYNSMYLFFNAAMQSAARFTRTMATSKQVNTQSGATKSWKDRATAPAKLAGGIVAFEVMKTMFNIAMSGEDESGELYYNTIPDYIKERNSILFYGDGPNDYVKFPLPYGYNTFNNIGLTIGEISTGQRDVIAGGAFLGLGAANSFSPLGFGQGKNVIERFGLGFLPTALRFPVDLYANTSFTGNQIVREQYPFGAPVPEWTLSFRSGENAKALAKKLNEITGGTENISGAIDINPDPYAYLLSSYTAGLGKMVGQVANLSRIGYEIGKRKVERLQNLENMDQFLDELTTMRPEDTVPLRRDQIPFMRIIYGSENVYYSYDVFKENVNELGQYEREIKKGTEDIDDLDFTGIQELSEMLKQTKKSLEVIREAKQQAQDIEDYIDRLNAIHDLTEAELLEIKLFNKSFYELRGQYTDPRSRNAITESF